MNPLKTEKDHVIFTKELWTWLAENPTKDKSDSPFWEDIKSMYGRCPLCEWDELIGGHDSNTCNFCPIAKMNLEYYLQKDDCLAGAYYGWVNSDCSFYDREFFARLIVEFCDLYLETNP